jgi:hypothetical protein
MREALNLGLLRGGCAYVVIPVESSSGFSLVIRYELACGIGREREVLKWKRHLGRVRFLFALRPFVKLARLRISVVVFPVIRSETEFSTGETTFEQEPRLPGSHLGFLIVQLSSLLTASFSLPCQCVCCY